MDREEKNKYMKEWNKKNYEKVIEARKKFRENNPEKIKEYKKAYYKKNGDKVRQRAREYREKNIEKIKKYESNRKEYKKIYRKSYYKKNREKLLQVAKQYKADNPQYYKNYYIEHIDEIKIWHKKNRQLEVVKIKRAIFRKNKRLTNPQYKATESLRSNLRYVLREYTKNGRIMLSDNKVINYRAIISHLQPSVEKMEKYQIDHIKPLCTFDLTDPEQISEAFAPENHQWLTPQENMIKGSKS